MAEAGDRIIRERKLKASLWRIRRVKRRIEKGYYDRPEVRKEIVDALLDAVLGNGKRRVP